MPDGTTALGGDFAPAQSPVLISGLSIVPGNIIHWSATGSVVYGGSPAAGPDGTVNAGHVAGEENGISDLKAPAGALLGVFLSDAQPDLTIAPGLLDFHPAASRDYLTLEPLLKQVFFMGDGLTSLLDPQGVLIPDGATRLYLGTMDGFQWNNNSGQFDVNLSVEEVPEAGTWVAGAMLVGLGAWSYRRSAISASSR
jgi:hypothetical protein